MSKPWSESTKRWVVLGLIVTGAILFYMLRRILPSVILALLVAYLLNPLVARLARLRVPRTPATVLTYLILLICVGLAASILVPMVLPQVSSINVALQAVYDGLRRFAADYQTVQILDYSIDLPATLDGLDASLRQVGTDFASRSVNILFGVAFGFASTFVWAIFILVVSFWLIKDADQMVASLGRLVPEDYRDAVDELRDRVSDVWNAFFRGQLLLSLIVGVATALIMWLVGVKNALLLGVLAGILEVIPTFGPIIAAIPGVAVALFQGSALLPIGNGWFALLVIGLYVMIQQVENNFLAPRIVGASVKLHPLVVLIGAIGGATVGGILGAFLAAPVLGTARVLGEYVYQKLLEPEMPQVGAQPAEPPAQVTQPSSEDELAADEDA
jgi:predicted PurR-regulated permease PerM